MQMRLEPQVYIFFSFFKTYSTNDYLQILYAYGMGMGTTTASGGSQGAAMTGTTATIKDRTQHPSTVRQEVRGWPP